MHSMSRNSPARLLVGDDSCVSKFKGPKPTTFAFKLIATLWLAFVIGGAILLDIHATKPGQQGATPAHWPMASRVTLSAGGATLLVFVHPYCPCTRTTLGELAAIMTACQDQVTAYVLFVVPDDENPDWSQNELWQTAGAIPGVRAVVDTKAVEAARFGARTSGLTLLFNEHGTCIFSGGITASRGHAGDNIGRQAIVSYLIDGHTETSRAPTFGCALFAEKSTINSEAGL